MTIGIHLSSSTYFSFFSVPFGKCLAFYTAADQVTFCRAAGIESQDLSGNNSSTANHGTGQAAVPSFLPNFFDPAFFLANLCSRSAARAGRSVRISIQPIGQRIIDGLEALGALGGGGRAPLERFKDAGAAFLGGADLAYEVVGEVLAPRIVRPVQHAVQVGEQALVLRPERVQLRRLSPQLSGRDLNLFHSLSSLYSVTGSGR